MFFCGPGQYLTRALIALACIALCGAVGTGTARAQTPPSLVPYVQSNQGLSGFSEGAGVKLRTPRKRGIKAGEFLIWPSLILEGRWDSNVFQTDPEDTPFGTAPRSVSDAPILRVVPGLALSNKSPGKVAVTVGGEVDLRLYLTDDEYVKLQRGNPGFGAKGDLRLDFLPRGPVSFTVFDTFRRKLQERNFAASDSYDVNINRAGTVLSVHPGGRALNIDLGYAFSFTKFDDFDDLDSNYHELRFLTRWRFYPKTSALLEVKGQLRSWGELDDGGDIAASRRRILSFYDSKPLRAYIGINGFVTYRLALLMKLGYGNSYHGNGPSFGEDFEPDIDEEIAADDGQEAVYKAKYDLSRELPLIGQIELAYKISPTVLLAVGVMRDFNDSFYGNFYVDSKLPYIRFQANIGSRVRLQLYGDFKIRDFAYYDPAATTSNEEKILLGPMYISHRERRDWLSSGHVKFEVDISRWISMSVGYEMELNFTNFYILHNDQFQDVGKYRRHQVYGSVNLQY